MSISNFTRIKDLRNPISAFCEHSFRGFLSLTIISIRNYKVMKLIDIAKDQESTGDLIDINPVDLEKRQIEKGLKISHESRKVINYSSFFLDSQVHIPYR